MAEMDLAGFVGRPTGAGVVTVDRAIVSAFAEAVLDDNPVFRNREVATAAGFADIPVPPTFVFSAAQNWCQWDEEQPPDPTGGMILHGEQSFTYHRPAVVGEKLHHHGVVRDVYTKQSGERTMTFMVIETTYTDADGAPVVTSTMNLLHRS